MAQPPAVPPFDKNKAPADAPSAIRWLWGLVEDFFKKTNAALSRGLTVRENIAGAWVDIDVPAGVTFPMAEMPNPLPGGQRVHGVLAAGLFDPAKPGADLAGNGAVTVEWTQGPTGGLTVLFITGLPSTASRVRVLVLAE